jgi:tetratricopeptide (TPR) repeat protein
LTAGTIFVPVEGVGLERRGRPSLHVRERYNGGVRIRLLIVVLGLLTTFSLAQDSSDKTVPDKAPADKAASDKAAAEKAAARDREAGESSSRDTRIDISPPKDDAKSHPGSEAAVSGLDFPESAENSDTSGVQEFHPWNPMKAMKDIEVGNYYFRRKNYKGALDRYKEALYYKEGDALASFHLAECQEKLGDKAEARKYYEQYLKILPEGPLAKDAHASLERLAKK